MKKVMFSIAAILILSIAHAQRASINNDTITYLQKSYHVGDTLQLGYGSGNNKIFSFIQMGSALSGTNPLTSNWAKSDVVIDKVYKSRGKCYTRGKIINSGTLNLIGGNKVFIDIEGAVDNKELQ